MGGPDTGGGRLNTLKRAERKQIGRKERGYGKDAVDQGTRMNLGGGERKGPNHCDGKHINLILGTESRDQCSLCDG